MALSKSTITGRVPLPTDENLQFAELTFALSGLDTEGASVLPGGVSTRAVLVGSDIPAGFELWQNTAGLRGTHYQVLARWTVKDRDGVRDQYADLGIIQIGSDPSYTLADLINNGVPPAIGTFWSAITQAQYDAVIQAAADALASAVAAALYDGPWLDNVAAIATDTTLTYTIGLPGTVAPGDIVRTRMEGLSFLVVGVASTPFDQQNANGVRLLSAATGIGRIARAFGLTGASVSGDRAALNKVIAALNRSSTADTVTLAETLTIDGPLDRITKSGKYFQCYGAEINHDGGTLFTFGTGVTSSLNGGGVIGLRYLVPVSLADLNTCFIEQDGANRLIMKDIEGRFNKVWRGGMTGAEAGGYLAENINAGSLNNGQVLFEHGIGAVSVMRNIVLTANGVNRVFDETTLTGANTVFAKFGADRWDTMLWDGLLANGYGDGLLIDRTNFAKNVSNGKFTSIYFDFCARGITLKNTVGGGGINNMSFIGGWVVGMDGHGIHLPTGTGSHRNILFKDFTVILSGKNAVRLESAYMDAVKFDNVIGWYSNRLNPTNVGNERDDFVALAGGWTMINSNLGKSANNIVVSGVPNWQGRYGVAIAPNVGPYKFTDNIVDGFIAPTQLSVGSTTTLVGSARSCRVDQNMTASGAAAIDYAVAGAVTVPTTATVETNLTPFTIQMHIFGGTVSQVQHEGIQIGGVAGADFILKPGETWSVYYTVAPTITRKVMA